MNVIETNAMKHQGCKYGVPFGVSTKRFAKLGFHPELDKSGAMKREITKLGPGSFDPKGPQCRAKQGMNWRTKLEVEEFSKFLGFRNAHILKQRQFERTMRGPGSTDVAEKLFATLTGSRKDNVGFGNGPRFAKELVGQEAPPPNTYMRGLAGSYQQSKKTFSTLPTFEYDGFADRFKSGAKPYHLPPNLYELRDMKNTSDITRRTVSSKGPYSCFTGPRDGTTIKNHFAPPLGGVPEYFYVKPSDAQYLLEHPTKKRYGLFLKAPRFQRKPTVRHMLNDLSLCYRSPADPGPAHYNLSSSGIKAPPASKHAFDSSNGNARPPTDWRISPGPGRYNPKAPRCMKIKRPSWVFQSKADRGLFKLQRYSLFD
ncbi:hypothetical protein HUJ04_001158 [Dendroctonus ponderosae]|uniref:Uncharacterized protein n=1 Tax=Dendroctonus ponderosae TaxID=77166 RepID=A0AAR5Q4D2_DENPD|nr:hypothetical protein HUJ04_001158 [Dendroctonus ponderosae]